MIADLRIYNRGDRLLAWSRPASRRRWPRGSIS
jgi:hypothetical protein